MRRGDQVLVNYYGPCRAELEAGKGGRFAIEQVTDYPLSGSVTLKIARGAGQKLTLCLRIPAWCTKATWKTIRYCATSIACPRSSSPWPATRI